ncbi:SRPBCC family protein [Phycicoccus avicenniae]|uniref:SRPBCC family protein n=1 Tax=Phycicoccus avicenniae TaxID=2828860 RepID=UPI003D2E6FC2
MPTFDGALRLSADGPLPPDEAWARFTEPRHWPGWSPQIRDVDYPHDVVRPGTSGRVTGVGGLVVLFRVDAVDHDTRTWSWSVRSGPVRLALDHGVDAVAGGSRAWVVVRALWPVALGYAPLARLALGRLVRA